jgi:hypothetical protein
MLSGSFGGLGSAESVKVAGRSSAPVWWRLFAEADDVGAGGGEHVLDVGFGQAVVAAVA